MIDHTLFLVIIVALLVGVVGYLYGRKRGQIEQGMSPKVQAAQQDRQLRKLRALVELDERITERDEREEVHVEYAQRAAERDIATDESDTNDRTVVTARDREAKAGDLGEELKDLSHEMELETRTARHDVDLGTITGKADSAQKRRATDDTIYAERRAEDLKLEKMRALMELEERIAEREEREENTKLRTKTSAAVEGVLFCAECGAEVIDGVKFCTHCGTEQRT